MQCRTTWIAVAALLCIWLPGVAPTAEQNRDYLVLVDPGDHEQFLPAAHALARRHRAEVQIFDPENLTEVLPRLRRPPPRFVVFVLPPHKIDVDRSHRILELATQVDPDPFVDFEYGFITGRDGEAARRFVGRIEKAWKRHFGRKGALFGSWEGPVLPHRQPLTATAALGLDFSQHYVRTSDAEELRRRMAREALVSFSRKDVLLFFSHGYPDRMASCFRARDLREWKVRFAPAVLFNCACYNGVTGRWFHPGPGGRFEDRGVVEPTESVALQILDSGVAAYVAGIDPWHGPLTNQVFLYVVDDGMRLGQATKTMADRLALAFWPGRIRYEPTRSVTFVGEGEANRRRNGAGMILFGDPKLAPFAHRPGGRFFGTLQKGAAGGLHIRLGFRPLVAGHAGADFMLPQARLMDYYSVKTADFARELTTEIYRVLPLPAEVDGKLSRFRVLGARSGEREVPTRPPQVLVEETRSGRFLHVRVPLDVKVFPPADLIRLAREGLTIDLAAAKSPPVEK